MAVKFFDEQWYLARNPDVAEAISDGSMTAEEHFEQFGNDEGRSPSPLFDAEYYLEHNPDVRPAVDFGLTTAYDHFAQHGHAEGRVASPYFNPSNYLDENPDVADVVDGGAMSVYEHYQDYGMDEGRSPLASFDADHYLLANPDIAEAVEAGHISAAKHFLSHGVSENRPLSPVISMAAYLALNADVAAAVEAGETTALGHLLTHGLEEGRNLGNGISAVQFGNDPVYQEAMAAGDDDAVLARMSEVAPFLPAFSAPEDFELPADWPIPQDFVPPEGVLLRVPEGWVPEEPVMLPEYFEQPFAAEVSPEGVLSFGPEVTGEIRVINLDGQAAFTQGGFIAAQTLPMDGSGAVHLTAEQELAGLYSDIGALTVTGEGAVLAEGTAEADTIDASEWNVANLTIDAGEGDDVITIADTQTAVGGEGADTFVISATAGVASVITISDYDIEQGDIIDLSQVEGFDIFAMEVRGAEHDGTEWQSGEGYAGDSVGIWFSDDDANVEVTGARYDTMKFALPEIPGLEGYDTMQLNISEGGVLRAGDEAGEILRGGDGGQFLIGGTEADILSGGGGRDFFMLSNEANSRLNTMDHIVDLDIGEDALVGHTAIHAGSFVDGGSLINLDAATISNALNAQNFGANAGAYFTVGEGEDTRSFVVLNDDNAGFDANVDTIVEITGAAGDLSALSVIGVPDIDAQGLDVLNEMMAA